MICDYTNRRDCRNLQSQIDSVVIDNNPYIGYEYRVRVCRNGWINYKNNTDCKDGAMFKIKSEDAQYIIESIMTDIFCYDSYGHGTPMIDGYHWQLTFYKGANPVEQLEGWPGEDDWRNRRIKGIIRVTERYIHKSMGYNYMVGDTDDEVEFW